MFGYKLKAGALQLTLFIVVVIALLLATFIILVSTHKRFNVQTDFIIETTQNAQQGIDHSLLSPTTLNDTVSIHLKNEPYKTLKVHREFWGVFEKVITTSAIKKNRIQKVALIGTKQTEPNRITLHLKDNNRPLVLVGNTRIQGTAYLPKQGVKSGTISGHSYYGTQFIYGQTRVSSGFPKLTNETINHLKTIDNVISKLPQSQYLNLQANKVYKNSFLEPLKVIFSPSKIQLSETSLSGYIVVQSNTKIVVDASSVLKDVLLIAPKIEIKDAVSGNFQAMASEEIIIGKNCELNYPSALILNEKETHLSSEEHLQNNTNTSNQNRIIINQNVIIKGSIVYLGTPKQTNYNPQIVLEENATVFGDVYCNQNLELKGTVFGTVYTHNFIAKQSGSIYQNHIYNGTINIDELPKEYVGLSFLNSKKGVLQWLY